MSIKKLLLLVCALFVPCMALAQNNSVKTDTDKLMDSFLTCDAHFFQQLAKNRTTFEQFFDLATIDNIAYIPVENVQKSDKNSVVFKKTINYKGLTITGYQNIFIETPFYGQYYYWGFILNGNLDKTKEYFNNINWMKYSPTSYVANPQIYDRTSKINDWQANPYAIDRVIPRQGTIERSLYLESISDHNQTHIVCSIQGDITKDILYTIRPDMKPVYEKIEAYKLKKQKELEQQQQNQPSQPNADNKVNENDKKVERKSK